MRTRLGTLLVREGLLSPAQHLDLSERAEDEGLPFVSVLVRHGPITAERLVELLRRRFLLPVAGRPQLEQVPEALIALVPAPMAQTFLVCPCGEEPDGRLRLAMADATDSHAMDEVTYHLGRQVSRYVSLEPCIRWAVQHYYGLDMGQPSPPWAMDPPDEEIVLLTKVKIAGRLPPPPAPPMVAAPPPTSGKDGLPPDSPPEPRPSPETDPPPIPLRRKRRGTLLGLPKREAPHKAHRDAYANPREDASAEVGASAKMAIAPTLRAPLPSSTAGAPTAAGLWSAAAVPAKAPDPRSEAYSQAAIALKRARGRDEVGRILLHYFEAFYLNVLLLAVRGSRLVGHAGGGTRLPQERISGIQVDLVAPSRFREAIAGRIPYHGLLGEDAPVMAFKHQIGYAPGTVLLVPIHVGQRAIAMMYADSPMTTPGAGELDLLLAEANAAYESVILTAKGASPL